MATYVLGDVHGQLDALERLLDRLELDLARDRLWLVGDLVGRGPRSLGVLRRLHRLGEALGERLQVVLGNHDLRLLAFAAGIDRPRRRDLLDEVLAAPDRGDLLAWLGSRPLLVRRDGHLLVHAGLLPSWSPAAAAVRAAEAEEALRGRGARELLGDWRAGRKVADPGRERRRQALAVLTGIRTCTAAGELCAWSGPPAGAPPGCRPWFRWHEIAAGGSEDEAGGPGDDGAEARGAAPLRVVFGHWAALGLHVEARFCALDSGAAWGGHLSALRLEDGRVVQEPVLAPSRGRS